MTPEETVTISKREYERLLRREDELDFLECRGVDNWEGYGRPPRREDYATDQEYQAAWQRATDDY